LIEHYRGEPSVILGEDMAKVRTISSRRRRRSSSSSNDSSDTSSSSMAYLSFVFILSDEDLCGVIASPY